jgi:hypothetical protein
MRRLALPIAICLASYVYGCAAADDSMPAGGGNSSQGGSTTVGGSPGVAGTTVAMAGTAPATGGMTGTAGSTTGTAGSTTGTAGTAPTAGSGSGGGAPMGGTCVMKAASTAGMPMLIDDLEDGNADITAVDGRMGGWFLSTDMTGTVKPAAGVPVPETGGMPGKAIHITGMGLTKWGASLSVAIANNLTGCYDASKLTGISVSLKGTGAIMVSVLTAAVRDAPEGMRNHYKKQITLTSDWTTVPISWAELMQLGGWGLMVPFDASKIYGLDFGPVQATAPATTSYDFWVDNVSFK